MNLAIPQKRSVAVNQLNIALSTCNPFQIAELGHLGQGTRDLGPHFCVVLDQVDVGGQGLPAGQLLDALQQEGRGLGTGQLLLLCFLQRPPDGLLDLLPLRCKPLGDRNGCTEELQFGTEACMEKWCFSCNVSPPPPLCVQLLTGLFTCTHRP